jgi:PAS domain S-box-containing protein
MHDFFDFFKGLLSDKGFIPRWVCGDWTDFHGWFYIISDGLIWLAYFAIPILLFYYLVKRSELPFLRVFWWFIAFILFCGLTHLIEVVIFWYPVYRLSAFVKFLTAIVSIATVFALIKHLPKALQAKSPAFLKQEIERKTAELKRLNDELNIQKVKFETIMNASSAGLILFNEQAKVENANAKAAEIFGYSLNELEKQNLNSLLPNNFEEYHKKMFHKFLEQPNQRPMGVGRELSGQHKNGRIISLEIGLSPMKVKDEQKVLATINDIELRKLKDEQKEREILNFKELNTQLESKNEELEDVSYIVSHNLRSPIQNIKGLLELTNEKEFEFYDKFKILIERLSFTVDDLNKVIQQNKMSIPSSDQVHFSDSIKRVLKSLSIIIDESKAQIEFDFGVAEISYLVLTMVKG